MTRALNQRIRHCSPLFATRKYSLSFSRTLQASVDMRREGDIQRRSHSFFVGLIRSFNDKECAFLEVRSNESSEAGDNRSHKSLVSRGSLQRSSIDGYTVLLALASLLPNRKTSIFLAATIVQAKVEKKKRRSHDKDGTTLKSR